MDVYDIIVVGAGPGGLSAAANAAHRGLKTLLLESEEKPGGQPMQLYPNKIILDHPGFPKGISGKALSMRLYEQTLASGAEIHLKEAVTGFHLSEEPKRLETGAGSYLGKKIIIATGLRSVPRKHPMIPDGKSVHYNVKDPRKFTGRRVVIIGGGDSAFERASMLSGYAASVIIVVRADSAKAKQDIQDKAAKDGAKVYLNSEVISWDGRTLGIRTGEGKISLSATDIILSIGYVATLDALFNAGLKKDRDGIIKVDQNMQTSIPGVFAVGDLVGRIKLIALACSQGIIAAVNTFEAIKEPYWLGDKKKTR